MGVATADSLVTSVVPVKRLGSAKRRAKRLAFAAAASISPGLPIVSVVGAVAVVPSSESVSVPPLLPVLSFPDANVPPGVALLFNG